LVQLLSVIGQVVLYEDSSSDATLNRPLVFRRKMADFGRLQPFATGSKRPEAALRDGD
jgi:hypothetical protein